MAITLGVIILELKLKELSMFELVVEMIEQVVVLILMQFTSIDFMIPKLKMMRMDHNLMVNNTMIQLIVFMV